MNMLIPDSNSYIPPAPDNGRKRKRFSISKVVPFAALFILSGALVGGSLLTIKYKPELLGLSKGQTSASADVNQIAKEVGKIIELPTETPVLYEVTDSELPKIRNQQFFNNAKVGDKVLIYSQSKKAYLYRPSEKKIIEVGRVNEQQGEVAGEKNISVNTPTPTTTTPIAQSPTQTPTPVPTTSQAPTGSVPTISE